MRMLPPLRFESFQTGFVSGAQASDGGFVLKRAAELSREWNGQICVAQLDLTKAFDRVKHSAVLNALRLQGCSMQCLGVISTIFLQSQMSVRLGHVNADAVDMRRGLPQGAPESPLIFVIVMEYVLRPLLRKWWARGSGWSIDSFWLASMCFADDVLLVSTSVADLERMGRELVEALGDVGLEVSAAKCHWTSYPRMPVTNLNLAGAVVTWEPHIIFVGSVFNFGGNDGEALEHRLAQATKVFYKRAPYLQRGGASLRKRLQLLGGTVFLSALWLCEIWVLTKQQRRHLSSWGARLASRSVLVRRGAAEEAGQYWRRLHRVGHELLRPSGGTLDRRRATRLHSFAGHTARTRVKIVHAALRTRPLSWWRFHQAMYLRKRGGLHPKRFKVWRWESQLTVFYAEIASDDTSGNVGWMAEAQDRDLWKRSLGGFLQEACG